MSLASQTRIGPYEIIAPLGAGGMGEVYRARDTRLGREVAIKILPQHLTGDTDARQRFEREARAISSLQHAHICVLHDIGHQDGTDFIVMEYLEGETLAKRVERGPLATAELLRIAVEIADALEKAHRQGILHRDLKPANIMLTKSGAKLMDFGLAKAVSGGAAPVNSLTHSLNRPTTPVTAQGTIVGTFQYMSPEQMEGKEADARSDIFSLGAVLYEMATGKRAFDGKTTASVIAAILEREPPEISAVRPMSPPVLDRTVKTCLAKDPDERFQSAHDVKLQLEWIRDAGSRAGVPPTVVVHRKHREGVAWTAAALLLVIAALFAAGYFLRAPQPAQAVIAQIAPPENARFALWGVVPGRPALSPDGTQLAFVAQGSDGRQMLWVRPLNSSAARMLEGTEDAAHPFWSPDGRSIAYFVKAKLSRIDVSGGPPIAVAEVGSAAGGAWGTDGTMFVSSQVDAGQRVLLRVPAAGGRAEEMKNASAVARQIGWTQFLPDGKHFLYYASSKTAQESGTYVTSPGGGEPRLIFAGNSRVVYARPGYLLFVRDGTLMAQRFDAKQLRVTGEAMPLAQDVEVSAVTEEPVFTVSQNGTLVYASGAAEDAQILWYDRSGKIISRTGAPGDYGTPSISAAGTRLAVSYTAESAGSPPDIWAFDLVRGVKTRITSSPMINADAFWSPDGRNICFVSNRAGQFRLYEKAADGTGTAVPLVPRDDPAAAEFFGSWSADGRYLAFQHSIGPSVASNYGPASGEIWGVALTGDRKPFPVVQNGQFVAIQPALSPDGKWLAYVSDETGQQEVYVVPFPHGSGKTQISSGGGGWPRWSRNGKELFYRATNKLMSVGVEERKGELVIGKTQALFPIDPAPGGLGSMYDVSADGKKFVVVSESSQRLSQPLTVVVNWPALLKKE